MRTYLNLNNSKMYIFASVGVFIALSEAVYDLVFANLAYSITGTTSAVTTTYAVGYIAELLVTLLGAGFIDRFNKWKLFIATQIINIIVFTAATIILSFHTNTVAWVWTFAFLVDLIHQYSRLIMFALVPFLFEREEIPGINGFLATMNGVARSVGPAIGAIAILQIGLSRSLTVSVAFMLVALLLALSLVSRYKSRPLEAAEAEHSSFKQRFQESITGASRTTVALLRARQWRAFLGSYSACVLVISVLALLWIPLLRDFHEFTPDQTGYLYSIGAAGAVLGGFTTKRYGGGNFLQMIIFIAHFVMLAGVITTLLIRGNAILVGVGMFAFQFGATVYFRTTASAIQLSVPKNVIGSWYGAIDFTSRFAGLTGILLAGWRYDQIGVYWVYSGLLLLLVVSALNWTPSRKFNGLLNSTT